MTARFYSRRRLSPFPGVMQVIEFVFLLLPVVLDAGRMEVARVKARLAGN